MTTLTIHEGRLEQWSWAVCGLVAYGLIEAHEDLHFWRYPLICAISAAVVLAATLFPSHAINLTATAEGVVFTLERSCLGFWKTKECRTLGARAQVVLAFETDSDEDITARIEFGDGTSWRAPDALVAKRAQVRAFLQGHGVGVSVRETSV